MIGKIKAYIRMRFSRIYEEDRYRYNERLRAEVAEVFGVQMSGESLRRVCQELKVKTGRGGEWWRWKKNGLLIQQANDGVDVHLFPTAHYSPALRRVVQKFLDQMNATEPRMPDRSGRRIRFSLGEKEGIQIAISNE